MSENMEVATLGGGCFWCVEAICQDVAGVHSVVSGYAGGHLPNPTYQQVSRGNTGHAEVAQITFDPAVISYEDVLAIYWRTHDPTTPDRQGADVGPQYRSIILYHDEKQKRIAAQSLAETDASGLWPNPIVTAIAPLTVFYPAEDYHQNYFKSHPYQPYCIAVIDPKVRKFRRQFKERLKE